jgi:hypothetical protein
MALKEIWCEGVDWMKLAEGKFQRRVFVKTLDLISLRDPYRKDNSLLSEKLSFPPRMTLSVQLLKTVLLRRTLFYHHHHHHHHHHHYHHQWLQSLQGPWLPHAGGYVIFLRHLVELIWTSDQPVAKASTYTWQHDTETQRQTSMPRAGFESTIPVTKIYALGRAATGTGLYFLNLC